MAGMDYPEREPFFAAKAIRLMMKTCLANEIGVAAAWLITVIAQTEDSARYRRPVTYWGEQLMSVAGFSDKRTFRRARDAAVKSGWLIYQEGGTRKPGYYWVNIPEHAIGLDDSPIDEGWDAPRLSIAVGSTEIPEESIRCKNVPDQEGIRGKNAPNHVPNVVPNVVPPPYLSLKPIPEEKTKNPLTPFSGEIVPASKTDGGNASIPVSPPPVAEIPPELSDWITRWNRLADEKLVPHRVDPASPSDAVIRAWTRSQKDQRQMFRLANSELVERMIRRSEFCRGRWFRLEKLFFGKNQDQEFILVKLIDGAYERDRNTKPARAGIGVADFDPERPATAF